MSLPIDINLTDSGTITDASTQVFLSRQAIQATHPTFNRAEASITNTGGATAYICIGTGNNATVAAGRAVAPGETWRNVHLDERGVEYHYRVDGDVALICAPGESTSIVGYQV
ncbi:MAG: hypothetical protein ACLQU2_01240 [Candidatus Binataceae bacterium]